MRVWYSWTSGSDSLKERLALGQVHPALEMGFGVEPEDRHPVVLDARNRRFEAEALKPRRARLSRRDTLLPRPERVLLPGFDPGGENRRDRRRRSARGRIAQEVHIVHADQHRLYLRDQLLPRAGMQPGDRAVGGFEALQDHPIDLHRRIGRHDRLLYEPGLRRDRSAHPRLPFRERFALPFPRARLDDDGDWRISGRDVHLTALRGPKMRSGVSGRCAKRTPVAFISALAIAGATGLIAHSPCALAPSGPIRS